MNLKKTLTISLLLFAFLLLIRPVASAQTIPQNLSAVNVDELSDDQVRQIMQQAQSSGLSDAQLIESARKRGMPDTQIQRLQSRIAAIRAKSTAADTAAQVDVNRKLNYTDTNVRPQTTTDPLNGLTPRVFGADLFNGSNISFEPNLRLATPLNYVLGPDDQLNVNVYGNSLVNWKLNVSPEGNINIPGVGILNVGGKTIEQATAAIKSRLSAANYAIGRGTNVKVTLGDIRSIKVIINGEVVRPGTYTLPSLATVFNALYQSGGPNNNGSFRQIEIIRNNRIIRRLDVYDFLLKGDQSNNITLRDQDIIRVPTYRVRVEMSGEVKRPALFEVLPGESLADVIRFAGGFSDVAYVSKIKVLQISGQERSITDVFEDDYKNYTPLRGDRYIVERILERFTNRVRITGAVFRPGDYELDKGLTVSQLIAKASGLKEDAFTARGLVTRLNPDNTTQLISFSVAAIQNKTAPDIILQREDVVSIASIFDLRDEYKVTIKGEVRQPGDFAYADSMTVEDVILKAGGLAEGASSKRIEVSRRINNNPNLTTGLIAQVFSVNVNNTLDLSSANFRLKPFDIVSVYSTPGYEKQKMVKVEGEVLYPGYYAVQKKNEKISDLVARAGGLTATADVDGGTLKRENTAILGFDKEKADTNAIRAERNVRLQRLKGTLKDSSNSVALEEQLRNSYVGIDLKRILKKPGSKTDLILEDGDILRVPKQQQIVRVNGEVLFPSSIVYTSGKSFKSYVLNAGGYTDDALRRGAYVVYPNGTVKGTSKFLMFNINPEVKPGSEIFVPKKAAKRGVSTQELIGITTGVASLAAIIFGIINLSN